MSTSQSLNVTSLSLTSETQMLEEVLPLNTFIPCSSVLRLESGQRPLKRRRTKKGKKLESGQPPLKRRMTSKGKKDVSFQEPQRTRSQTKGVDDMEYNVVMERAKEIKEQLSPSLPSFIRFMQRSNVTHGFWLSLPWKFCTEYLPKCRRPILLVGEDDETEYKTNFIADRQGLSGGWKLFSLAHNIAEGDAAVFQLQLGQPYKFKVYIVRLKDVVGEVDRALSPLSTAGTSAAHYDIEGSSRCDVPCTERETSPLPVLSYDNCRETNRWTTSFVDFQNFETGLFDSGICAHLKEDVVHKYYDLCCSQNSFLHQRVAVKCTPLTAASAIVEAVKIADAIRTSNTGTPQHEIEEMENTLLAFEQLGMEVGFLLRRLSGLASIASKSRRMSAKRYRLDRKIEKNDLIYSQEAAAPW